jgi:hypothetical protein
MKAGLSTDRWKKTVEDYLQSAWRLFWQIKQHGFSPDYPVPIDPDGELLDGSHRVACAVALGLTEIPVERHTRMAWAPAWGWDWFVAHGMAPADLETLRADWAEMRR